MFRLKTVKEPDVMAEERAEYDREAGREKRIKSLAKERRKIIKKSTERHEKLRAEKTASSMDKICPHIRGTPMCAADGCMAWIDGEYIIYHGMDVISKCPTAGKCGF